MTRRGDKKKENRGDKRGGDLKKFTKK
jgi:hypothetical protein